MIPTFTFTMPKTLNASVIECPTVKAVMSIRTFFQSFNSKPQNKTTRNKIWSYALTSAICHSPSVNQSKKSFNASE